MTKIIHAQPPDVQGNSVNGLPENNLPMGSSLQGMTDNVHPGMSLSEVHDGFEVLTGDGVKGMSLQREGDEIGYAPSQSGGGFSGRPGGWER